MIKRNFFLFLLIFTISLLNACGSSSSDNTNTQEESSQEEETQDEEGTQEVNTPPISPSNISISGITWSTAVIIWGDNSDNETGFVIEISEDDENYTQVATTEENITEQIIQNLDEQTTYYVRVTASNNYGNAISETSSFTTTSSTTNTTTAISQFGITWQFSEAHQYGQFANGDYWILGPVEITGIYPSSQEQYGFTTLDGFSQSSAEGAIIRVMNGSMLNPSPTTGGTQGYDSETFAWHPEQGKIYGTNYNSDLNAALNISAEDPLTISSATSLVSSVSHPNGYRPQIKTQAVLTILNSTPTEGSFRPPYSGTDKSINFNISQINYSLLEQLETVSSQPEISVVSNYFEKPWIDHVPNWGARYTHASDNMPDYGREISAQIGIAALMLHLDIPVEEKRELLIRYLQLGIDLYGITENGGEDNWPANGGHESGRKWPILFAGLVLGNDSMANISNTDVQFGEDGQTFYVTQEVIDRTYRDGYGGYTSEHLGMAEYGIRHSYQPDVDDVSWDASYRRCCTANAWAGFTLSALIMDEKDTWNHNALFDYMDRYMETEPSGYYRQTSNFVEDMWDKYR